MEKLDFNDYIANESGESLRYFWSCSFDHSSDSVDDEEGSDAEMEKIEAKLRAKNGEDDEKKEETKAEKKKVGILKLKSLLAFIF